jgi:gliding motility-associated-like protein
MSKNLNTKTGNYLTLILIILTIITTQFQFALAQSSSLTKVIINTRNNGQSNNPDGYIEYLPNNYNSRNDWPVLIWHHGLGKGGNGSSGDLNKLLSNQIMNWLKTNDEPFVVLAPQDYNGYFGNGKLELFYNWAKKNYATKTNKDAYNISVLSASGAGLSTFLEDNNLAAKEVATVTVNGALTGTGNNTIYTNVVNNNTKVWFHHGDADGTVGYGAPLNFYRGLLDKIGGQDHNRFRYTLYSGLGHSAWEEVYDNSGQNRNKVTGSISGGNYGNYYNWTSGSWYQWMIDNAKIDGQASPVVNASTDKTLNLPTNSINITGSASSSGGTIDSYLWTKINGPSAFTLSNTTVTTVSVSGLVAGVYTFRFTATDNLGQSGSDEVKVTVNNTNQNPSVSAGTDKTITLPTNSITLNGSSSDADGTISTKVWTQQQGPNTATLSGKNTNTLNASNLQEGTYRFRLIATDDDGASSFDQVDVLVNPAAVNSTPSANAGQDKTVNLPTNSTTLNGSGADSDGSISSYLWTKVSGPAGITIGDVSKNILSLSNLVAGSYQFQLTVTDNDGASDSDLVAVEVIAANINPNVNAGSNKQITLPTNSLLIKGAASDTDGSISSYLWTQISGPNTASLANANTSDLTVSNLIEGVYTFSLGAKDNDGAEGNDEMTVTVLAAAANNAPIVSAGDDKSITLPANSIEITGSASDVDGTISTILWSKQSGPNAFTINSPSNLKTQITALIAGTYVFKLTVTDDDGSNASDIATINVAPASVNQSPTANAGPDKGITLPSNSVTINGSGTDPDGTIASYQWSQDSGPSNAVISTPTNASTVIASLIEGSYAFSLQVTDDDGSINTDQANLTVTAANVAPSVFAGLDIAINLPKDSIAIIGKATDSDGVISSSSWTQLSGPSPTLNIVADTLKISDLVEGTYKFEFSAIDDDGANASDQFILTVSASSNVLPSVNAGNDVSINLPTNTINLTATATDTDGAIQTYLWGQLSGPAATITNASNKTVSISNLLAGIYDFNVTVTDNEGGAASDDITLTVLEATINQPPLADAGETIIIAFPITSTTISGLGFDDDGEISSYLWSKKSGPSATLSNQTTATLSLTNLVVGTYTFEFEVTDNTGAKAADQVQLIVNPAETNQNPIANAGNDISLVLPISITNLIGNASDPDGEIINYQWIQLMGPTTATIENDTQANATVRDLVEGVYTFKFLVTDDKEAIDEDQVDVSVFAENTNIAPIANAGEDVDLYLPTNSINIYGAGSDDDGTIANYSWNKVSGPSSVILTNQQAPTLNVSNLISGIYEFRLSVIDNDGASTADMMRLRVFPETTNQSPTVNAGSDKSISITTDSLSILANASDPDGNIVSYLWSKTSGPAVTLKNSTTSKLTIIDFIEGIYNFRISVTDNDGAVNFDEIKVNVLAADVNSPPIANAGNDLTIKLPTDTITIHGTGTDLEGPINTFYWEQISGPTASLKNESSESLKVLDLKEGTYSFSLEVTDSDGATARDNMTLFVLSNEINLSPTVNAGSDQLVDEGSGELQFEAIASDEDGSIDSYLWEKISGGQADLSSANTKTLSVSNYEAGNYEFSISVTDDKGAIDNDIVLLTVFPIISIPPPTVFAGNDTTIITPIDSVVLIGYAASETLLSSYRWEQISGPKLDIFPIDSNIVVVNKIPKGNYIFELSVTDIENQSSFDDISLIIKDNITTNDFPIIFTPNNDGANDLWVIEDASQIENCKLIIYNTLGQVVFQSDKYRNDWDGTLNGTPLPAGAYYFVFECQDQRNFNGAVRIIR